MVVVERARWPGRIETHAWRGRARAGMHNGCGQTQTPAPDPRDCRDIDSGRFFDGETKEKKIKSIGLDPTRAWALQTTRSK